MILITLYLRDHNETDFQIYPGAFFFSAVLDWKAVIWINEMSNWRQTLYFPSLQYVSLKIKKRKKKEKNHII